MSEYDETDEQQGEEEEVEDLWAMLKMDDPGDNPYDDLQDEQDEDIAKVDKMERKLSSKMDEMQKKIERTLLRERIEKFQASADDLEKDLFRTVASDVKDIESFDKAMNSVTTHSKKMREAADKYKKQMEQLAEQQAARAWGTGPIGSPAPKNQDYIDDLRDRVMKGDDAAAFEYIIGDDWPSFDKAKA